MSAEPFRQRRRWAVEWRTVSALHGDVRQFLGDPSTGLPRLFATRREASAWIEAEWAFLRDRPDLEREPHGWRMPRPVRVLVTVEKVNPSTPT